MSRLPSSAETSLIIVAVLLIMVVPASFAGTLIAVIRYPDSWPLQLVGYVIPSACCWLLLMYLILSIEDQDVLEIALPMSAIPLAYSLMTVSFLPIFAAPNIPTMIAVAIVSPIIGFAFALALNFRICVLRDTHRRRPSPTNSGSDRGLTLSSRPFRSIT